MRVITGTLRGKKLTAPEGAQTRPTSDMVKESIFNIIQFDVAGRRVLDLFAGSGQMGIEALSRGAQSADFVDSAQSAVQAIKKNLSECKLEDKAQVFSSDVLAFLRPGRGPYGLIFVDAPYASGLTAKALKVIGQIDILSAGGIIICETDVDTALDELTQPYQRGREYRYGKKKITLYGKDTRAGQ